MIHGAATGASGGLSEWDGAVGSKSLLNLLKICPFAAVQISSLSSLRLVEIPGCLLHTLTPSTCPWSLLPVPFHSLGLLGQSLAELSYSLPSDLSHPFLLPVSSFPARKYFVFY